MIKAKKTTEDVQDTYRKEFKMSRKLKSMLEEMVYLYGDKDNPEGQEAEVIRKALEHLYYNPPGTTPPTQQQHLENVDMLSSQKENLQKQFDKELIALIEEHTKKEQKTANSYDMLLREEKTKGQEAVAALKEEKTKARRVEDELKEAKKKLNKQTKWIQDQTELNKQVSQILKKKVTTRKKTQKKQ